MRGAIVALGRTLAACAPGAPNAAEIKQGVREHLTNWAATASEGRWDDLTGFFVESDLAWVENGEVRYASRADVAAAVADIKTNDIAAEVVIGDIKVTPIAENAAVVVADLTTRFNFAGEVVLQPQILTAALVRQEGRWYFQQGQIAKRPREEAKR